MKHLIVALHNEDPAWIGSVPSDWGVFVYHKGDKNINLPNANVIQVVNFGRESHSYFKYIEDHYENLPELMLFCQGNYRDHTPNLLEFLDKDTIQEMHDTKNKLCDGVHPISDPTMGYVPIGGFWVCDTSNEPNFQEAMIRELSYGWKPMDTRRTPKYHE